jgi:2-C-methyl-D-erythritol 4-phosphate cytidylyltransferase
MGHRYPKQYLPLHHKPVLQHTLQQLQLPQIAGIVVCLAADDTYWPTLTPPPHTLVTQGGAARHHSVLNGLKKLQNYAQPQDWVLVHDAARPCVRQTDIQRLMTTLVNHPVGGLLAVPVRDTMKRVDEDNQVTKTVERQGLWHALTPQMFRLDLLLPALQQVIRQNLQVTDEAQAIERLGYQPVLIAGHADNIKITHPQDLALATLYLQQQYDESKNRTGTR